MPRPLSMNIDGQTIQNIQNQINGRTAQELKQIGDNQNLLLKKYALDFFYVVQENLYKINDIEQQTLHMKEMRQSMRVQYGQQFKDYTLNDEYKKAKEKLSDELLTKLNLQQFFQASLIFNERILEIITGKPSIISVVLQQDKGPPIVAQYTIEELLSQNSGVKIYQDVTSQGQATGRLIYDIEQIKNHLAQTIHHDNIISGKSLIGLNVTYESALKTFHKFNPYVFWKPLKAQHWYKMKILGREGDINEAYAAFYYKGGNTFLQHLYNNLNYFYTQGVAKVDIISGLYSSDVQVADYNYAVKSFGASLPGFRQMIILSQRILNGKIKDVKQLQDIAYKKQWKGTGSDRIQRGLRNYIEEVLDDELPDQLQIYS